MNRSKAFILTAALTVLLAPATVLAQDDPTSITTEEKIYGLSYFWKEVSYNFAFFDQVPDLDWDSAYVAFIPRVMATSTDYEYYRELQRFCALLKDGHTSVNFPAPISQTLTYPKLLLAEYDHRMYVRNVDSSLIAEIPIGSEILEIDGVPAIDFVRNEILPYLSSSTEHVFWDMGIRTALRGARGTSVALTYRTPDGDTRTQTVARDRDGVRWFRAVPDRPLLKFEWTDDRIARLELNSFNDTAIVGQFEALLPELYDANGVIIDLRNNPGGNSDNGTRILQHFASDTLWGSTWRTPEHIAAYKAWGWHAHRQGLESEMVPYYLGNAWHQGDDWFVVPDTGRKIDVPVVVLLSRTTGSAAEDFLVFADRLDQFVYVGEPTNGSTGQPLFIDNLPGGGTARICTKRDTYPDGRDFVGYGIQPDVRVATTVESLIDDTDPVFDKGLEVLKSKLGAE